MNVFWSRKMDKKGINRTKMIGATLISSFLLGKEIRSLQERYNDEKLLQILVRVKLLGPKERYLSLLQIDNSAVRKHKRPSSEHEF